MPVWIATPIVKITDQNRMDPRRPSRSEVNAWAMAPLESSSDYWEDDETWFSYQKVLMISININEEYGQESQSYPADSRETMIDCLELDR